MKLKKYLALLLAGILIFSLAACGKDSGTKDNSNHNTAADDQQGGADTPSTPDEPTGGEAGGKVQAIKDAGVLVVGTSADYPPYEFHTEIDGQDTIVGFDIAIAQYFADSLGVELKVVDMAFDSLLISLSKGDFDLVMAGLTPSEERKKAVDFTDVFFGNKQIVIIRKDDDALYNTTGDLAGKKGGAQTGTVQMELGANVVGADNVVGLTKFQDLIMELKSGKIDAVFTNSMTAAAYVSGNPDLEIKDIGIDYEEPGFAGGVQKGNEDLVEYLNGVIAEMQEKGLIDQYVAEAQALAGVEE